MSIEKIIKSEQENIRKAKIAILNKYGIAAYGNKAKVNITTTELFNKFNNSSKEELTAIPDTFKIMGRIILKRDQGKVCFLTIKDSWGKIQCYIRMDNLANMAWEVCKIADIGDIVWISGTIMKTNHNELTIKVFEFQHIVKAITVLPEKYHGLQDVEERYRNRHVDLIVNEDVKNRFLKRSLIIQEIRNFLNNLSYLEVETPYLHPILGGANAKPFKTFHNTLSMNLYLRVAPELFLKKLIVGGFDAVYEIGRNFRNEGIDIKHNPEFTSIELYKANADYEDMLIITENLIKHVAKKLNLDANFEYDNKKINLFNPWEKKTMVELVDEYTNFNFVSKDFNLNEAKKFLKDKKIVIEKHQDNFGHILNLFFENFVEDKLVNPTFVLNYPIEISPLSKTCKDDVRFTERFELYIAKFEVANAFSELNDPFEQYNRFMAQLNEKTNGNDEACEMDNSFILALLQGLPPTGGLGIGIDRLVMLLTNCPSIREVIFFPHLRQK